MTTPATLAAGERLSELETVNAAWDDIDELIQAAFAARDVLDDSTYGGILRPIIGAVHRLAHSFGTDLEKAVIGLGGDA